MLSKDEFLDLLFEDLELPNLIKTKLKSMETTQLQRAGYLHRGHAGEPQHPRAPCATAWRGASR